MARSSARDQGLLMVTPPYFYVATAGVAEWLNTKGFARTMELVSSLRRAFFDMYPDQKLPEMVVRGENACYLMTRKGDTMMILGEIPNRDKLPQVTSTDDFLTITGLKSYQVALTDF